MVTAGRSPRVVVLDYGSGNLRSAERALARAGADVTVTADADAALAADGLVVPGVGAFAACMDGLTRVNGPKLVGERVRSGRPLLGICVGMQVMFERGVEHGAVTKGLGVFSGEVSRLRAERVPHMGWNTVRVGEGSNLFRGVEDAHFYFVHSYAPKPYGGVAGVAAGDAGDAGDVDSAGDRDVVSTAEHGEPFVAAVERDHVAATQFHPEKSSDAGIAVLRNWLSTL